MRPNDAAIKLKQLALAVAYVSGGDEDLFAYYTPGYPSLLYGRWLREYEKAKPSVWRECFRARILDQINGLDDDDPTNDTMACRRLAMSLFQADDEDRASAIIAVLFKTLEEYISGKERMIQPEEERGEDDAPAQDDEENGTTAETIDADELANEATEKIGGEDKETADDSGNADTQTGVQAPDVSASQVDDGEKIEVFGPGERHSRRPQAEGADEGGNNDNDNKIDPHDGKLALQLESDAWGYVCDGCGYDAEDKGNMQVYLSFFSLFPVFSVYLIICLFLAPSLNHLLLIC